MRIAGVILAAGQGKRFGGDKLLADIGGLPMIAAALDALLGTSVDLTLAVVSDDRLASIARERGAGIVMNDAPERGLSHSIRLGLAAAKAYDAALFLAADQPLLTAGSLQRLIDGFCAHGGGLACLRDETHSGNPAVFAREFYPALDALTGDRGAKSILKANRERLLEVDCLQMDELSDADDPQALSQMLARSRIKG